MQITTTTLQHAFWRILSQHDAESGTPLKFRNLEHDWGETGLRHGDLRDAVRMTLESGWIECVPENDGLALRLTSAGYRNFYRAHAVGASLSQYGESESVLQAARQRLRVPGEAPAMDRRREDHEQLH